MTECPELGALEISPLPAELRDHVSSCNSCKLVVEVFDAAAGRLDVDDCMRFDALLAARADGTLGRAAKNLLERHLASCSSCREVAETLSPTQDADGDHAISAALCDGNDCCDSGAEASLGCSVANAPMIGPGVTEVCGDGIDQDCDGVDPPCQCTIDQDNDGHRALACLGDDCCDSGAEPALGCTAATAPDIYPGSEEICGDAIDQDCDGIDPGCQCTQDADGDGHLAIACGGDDCCDAGTEASVGCTPGTAGGIFPGNPEICGDGIDQNCNGTDLICKAPTPMSRPLARPQVAGEEPVFVLAVQGDGGLARGGSSTTATGLTSFEACGVDMATGRLACGDSWVTQTEMQTPSREALGLDALLYFHFLFPFTAAEREVCTASTSTRDLSSSSIGRYEVNDPDLVTDGNVVGPKQSGSAKFMVNRSHYQLVRLMSYIFAIGGWTASGPTDAVERHLQ